jgi:glycosyltransferase involved in cell wall biosynthesis
MNTDSPTPRVTVIIPVFNEAENIDELCAQTIAALDAFSPSFEIIIVDDGSRDGTLDRLLAAAAREPRLRILGLRRNYGQTAAMSAGIDHAQGEIIVPMDGDLQNDPADISRVVSKLDEGYDVVSGWRRERKDDALRRNFVSKVANRLISWISGVHLHDYGCTLKAYRREVLQPVRLYGEMHRFIPIYASWYGNRVTEIEVAHHARKFGSSKYGLERIFKVLLDLMLVQFLARYQTKPIHVFGSMGLIMFVGAILAGLFAVGLRLFASISFISTPLPLLFVMLFVTGVLCMLMGILAEMMMRIYFESQQKKIYDIRTRQNFP